MNLVENYQQAVVIRQKTPEDVQEEMDSPGKANFAIFDYHFPNGIRCGIGKSKRPSHASLFQIIVTDFDGKPNVKIPEEYAGEYTSTARAEKGLHLYCKEAWEDAEKAMTKATRKGVAEKDAAKSDN